MKTNQNQLNKVIPPQLVKFVADALMKIKNVWKHENTLSGIQFYGDLED